MPRNMKEYIYIYIYILQFDMLTNGLNCKAWPVVVCKKRHSLLHIYSIYNICLQTVKNICTSATVGKSSPSDKSTEVIIIQQLVYKEICILKVSRQDSCLRI